MSGGRGCVSSSEFHSHPTLPACLADLADKVTPVINPWLDAYTHEWSLAYQPGKGRFKAITQLACADKT